MKELTKALTVGFSIPDPDLITKDVAYYEALVKAGPHIDFMKRLKTAVVGKCDVLGWEVKGDYYQDPSPSQPAIGFLLCDDENVSMVESIIWEAIAADDHGLLDMSLVIEDAEEFFSHDYSYNPL